MDLGLENKVALVAGSSKGLGYATVKVLLTESAYVVINGRNLKPLKEAEKSLGNPNRSSIFPADVTQSHECAALIQHAIDTYGKLDILITNSGGPKPGDFEHLGEADWDEAISKSLKSHIYLIGFALPHLKKSDHPSILTITSFTVKQPLPGMVLSNSVRAATAALTKSLSKELGKYNIRVNSILPGWTYTDRVRDLINNRSQAKGISAEAETASISDSIPLGRLGNTEEFARTAAFLVSPAASFINGVMMSVDGGLYQGLF